MGMIKNDIDDVVSALIQERPRSKVAKRLIESGLLLLIEESNLTTESRIVPSDDMDGTFHIATMRKVPRPQSIEAMSDIDFLKAAFGEMTIASNNVFVIRVDEDVTGFTVECCQPGMFLSYTPGDVFAVLREAATTFDDYASNHLDKEPPQFAKARRNQEMAEKCYAAIGEVYAARDMPPIPAEMRVAGSERGAFDDWKRDVQAGEAAKQSTGPILSPASVDSALSGSTGAFGTGKALLRAIYDAAEAGEPIKGIDLPFDDMERRDMLVEFRLATRDDVTDLMGVTTEGRLALGIRPRGVIDLPVKVQEITGNIAESELVARYLEGKIAAIDKSILLGEAPIHEMNCSWQESYQHVAITLRAAAQEFRIGLHVPSHAPEHVVIPYNDDRSTGISHRVALHTFFADCHERNVKAGWWTDIETGEPKKRSPGELMMLMVTELAESYDAWMEGSNDDKLPQYPGVCVEMGDLLIRVADFCGALATGRIVMPTGTRNPGDTMFRRVRDIGREYEAIRKTPEAKGDPELGVFLAPMDVAVMTDDKLAFNATRADHKIENRLKADGKRT